jgi:AcrR family transcriptional regulator
MRLYCFMLVSVPKRVDHQVRRREIADALWRVVASNGFAAVSFRQVAAEAGVSMGLVQHYFDSREQMLLFALDSVSERARAHIAAELADQPEPSPRTMVRALLTQVLPLDEQRRREGHALFAFLVEGGRGGVVGERMRTDMTQFKNAVAEQIRAGRTSPDPDRAAVLLLAVTDGLTAHVLSGYLDPTDALAALDQQLDHAFGSLM